jgi:hypothetical protein
VVVQNVVLAPPEMPYLTREDWATTHLEDGKLLFYVENQGVCEWATSPEDTDEAPVWIRVEGDWELEEAPLSAFLVQVLVFEAIWDTTHGASESNLERHVLAQVVEPLHRLPGSWRWPSYPGEFYAGDRILAFACPNDEPGRTPEYFTLWLAALD